MAERTADGGAGASFFLGQVEIENPNSKTRGRIDRECRHWFDDNVPSTFIRSRRQNLSCSRNYSTQRKPLHWTEKSACWTSGLTERAKSLQRNAKEGSNHLFLFFLVPNRIHRCQHWLRLGHIEHIKQGIHVLEKENTEGDSRWIFEKH